MKEIKDWMRDKVRQQRSEELHIISGKCEQIFQNSLQEICEAALHDFSAI
jgi:hypothetical protein